MQTKRIVVTGRVQDIGFRYFVKKQAREYDLLGWIRNLVTGEVELMITGEEAAIQLLVTHLLTGNGFSNIETINIESLSYKRFNEFEILTTKV